MMLTGGPALAAKSIRQMVPTAASILPPAVAKTVYENISAGMPVICYHLDGSGSGTTSTTAQNGGAASETKPQQTQPAAETKPQQSQAASNNPSGVHETTAAQNGGSSQSSACGAADDCSSSANHRGTAGIPADHRGVSADQRGFLWFRSGAGLSGTEQFRPELFIRQFFIRWSGKRRYIRRHSERTRWSGKQFWWSVRFRCEQHAGRIPDTWPRGPETGMEY